MLIHIALLGLGIASTELPGASANEVTEASDTLTSTPPAAPDQERPRVRGKNLVFAGLASAGVGLLPLGPETFYVGTVAGGALTVIGGTQMAITRGQQRRYDQADARNILEEPAPPDEPPESRRARVEARWDHLAGKKRVRRGSGLIAGGVGGLALSGLSAGAGVAAMSGCDGWGCVGGAVAAMAGIGLGTLIALPSVASIGAGSAMVHKGKKEMREAEAAAGALGAHRPRARLTPVFCPGTVGVQVAATF